jgi:hypothetical protein
MDYYSLNIRKMMCTGDIIINLHRSFSKNMLACVVLGSILLIVSSLIAWQRGDNMNEADELRKLTSDAIEALREAWAALERIRVDAGHAADEALIRLEYLNRKLRERG